MSDAEAAKTPPSLRKIPFVPILIILVLLGIAVFGQRGILRALQLGRQKAELEAQVKELEENNAALRREIEALRSDPRTIEAIARRELGMVKDDEVVYQFRPQAKKAGQAVAADAAKP